MNNIFNNWIEMDLFCYDIVEAWAEYRKSKNKTFTEDDFFEWVQEELEPALEFAYDDWIEDEEEEKNESDANQSN